MRLPLLAALAAACFVLPGSARAAAINHDACTGYIESLPATITTPGTWCMRKNLSTAIADDRAIDIGADDIRVDCGGFRVIGLAGPDSQAWGIVGSGPYNVEIRNCAVSGFHTGIVASGSGALVEGNRVEGNQRGIHLLGYGDATIPGAVATARRNTIVDSAMVGIETNGDVAVLDNIIDGVGGNPDDASERIGIFIWSGGHPIVSGNIVRNLGAAQYAVYGIVVRNSGAATLRDNVVIAMPGVVSTTGIRCEGGSQASRDNLVSGFATNVHGCVSFDDDTIN